MTATRSAGPLTARRRRSTIGAWSRPRTDAFIPPPNPAECHPAPETPGRRRSPAGSARSRWSWPGVRTCRRRWPGVARTRTTAPAARGVGGRRAAAPPGTWRHRRRRRRATGGQSVATPLRAWGRPRATCRGSRTVRRPSPTARPRRPPSPAVSPPTRRGRGSPPSPAAPSRRGGPTASTSRRNARALPEYGPPTATVLRRTPTVRASPKRQLTSRVPLRARRPTHTRG